MLSTIEQTIKTKIENLGIPLKEWNIQINYGIKTGYNEAFIIDGNKRKELIEKCPEADSIIRPILRGRDIQKYKANWQNLYIIGTFPSLKIDIENYPSIKNHLLSYGFDRLKQTGDLGARKKTHNQWFEIQDSINYWEDFFRPKIIYPEITKFINFYLDTTDHYYVNNKCFILTGVHIEYLTAFFNSKLFKFCFTENFPELMGGTRELRKVFFEKIPVMKISDEVNEVFKLKISNFKGISNKELEEEINRIIFELYSLTPEEIFIINKIN